MDQCKDKNAYIKMKKNNRENKQKHKRSITGEDVIFIFEKVLEGWKTIKIYNTIIQTNPSSKITKKLTETVATGNCKIYPSELSEERYVYYTDLRNKVYAFQRNET